MIFSLATLREFLKINDNEIDHLLEKLTSIGLEVESITKQNEIYQQFIVSKIVEYSKHPNADNLNLCKVDNGSEILEIVCGARNVKRGMVVILAPVGTVIPNGNFIINSSNIRGVRSNGMLCSAEELCIDSKFFNFNKDGIVELDAKYEGRIGQKLSNVLNLNDTIIEINITPNRGDCTGVFGVARDLSNCGFGSLQLPKYCQNLEFLLNDNGIDEGSIVAQFNSNKEINHFTATNSVDGVDFATLLIDKVDCNVESPDWLKSGIKNCGINPKNLIVDLTNYATVIFGKPTHSYDAQKISSPINIERVTTKESFLTLKDENIEIPPGTIAIKSDQQIISLGGIIGSKNSSVTSETKSVLFESAFFQPADIMTAGQKTQITSDARFRFERGVDHKLTLPILLFIATVIKSELPDAELRQINHSKHCKIEQKIIQYNKNNFRRITGVEIDDRKLLSILQQSKMVDCNQKDNQDCYSIVAPSYRYDIIDETDITEEILRIYGYDKLTSNNRQEQCCAIKRSSNNLSSNQRISAVLINSGMTEMINYSFINFKKFTNYILKNNNLFIAKPVSQDANYMRPSLIFGLIENLNYQVDNHRVLSTKIFENGKIFSGTEVSQQKSATAGLLYGGLTDSHLPNGTREYNLFDAKSIILNVLEEIYNLQLHQVNTEVMSQELALKSEYLVNISLFHPYNSFMLTYNNKLIGVCGQLNRNIAQESIGNNKKDAFVFELIIDNIKSTTQKQEKEEAGMVVVYREFAVLSNDKNLAIGKIIGTILNSFKEIRSVRLVDVYAVNNQYSYAFEIAIFGNKTLTIEQINNTLFSCIDTITKQYELTLRNR